MAAHHKFDSKTIAWASDWRPTFTVSIPHKYDTLGVRRLDVQKEHFDLLIQIVNITILLHGFMLMEDVPTHSSHFVIYNNWRERSFVKFQCHHRYLVIVWSSWKSTGSWLDVPHSRRRYSFWFLRARKTFTGNPTPSVGNHLEAGELSVFLIGLVSSILFWLLKVKNRIPATQRGKLSTAAAERQTDNGDKC